MNNIPIEIWLTAKDCELLVQKDYKWDVNVSTTKLRRDIGDDCIVKFISEESHIAAIKGATAAVQKLHEVTEEMRKDRVAEIVELKNTIEKLKNKELHENERISKILDTQIAQIATIALQGKLASGSATRCSHKEIVQDSISIAKEFIKHLGHE